MIIKPLTCLLIIIPFLGCENTVSPEDHAAHSWYFNSFESAADTSGWRGNAPVAIENNAPSNGGKHSALVSGGCLIPHAYFEFDPVKEDSYFILRCWGKNLGTGGTVSLSLGNDWQHSINIDVKDSAWTLYESADYLFVPQNQNMQLVLNAGGLLASPMLVDLIEIELVKPRQ